MNWELKFLPENIKNAINTLRKAKVQYEKRKKFHREEVCKKPIEEIMDILLKHESSKSKLEHIFENGGYHMFDWGHEFVDLVYDEDNSEYLEKLNSAEKMLDEKTFNFYYENYKDALKDSGYNDNEIRNFAAEAKNIIMKDEPSHQFYNSKAESVWKYFWPDGQGYAAPAYVLHHKDPTLKFENKKRYNRRIPSDLVMLSCKSHSKLHGAMKKLNEKCDMMKFAIERKLINIASEKEAIILTKEINDLLMNLN